MSGFRRLVVAISLIGIGLSLAIIQPLQVGAVSVSCSGANIMFGRQRWCGYFKNIGFDRGTQVRIGGVPAGVNTVGGFIALVEGDLNSGNTQRRTAASFIILNMLGRGPGLPQAVSAAQLDDWKARVRAYGDISENGTTSIGTSGRVDWSVWQHPPCGYLLNGRWYIVNTYYQIGQDDVAPYLDSNCGAGATTEDFLLFRDTNGNEVYRIRRACMNPMGTLNPLQPPRPASYNLTPAVGVSVGGLPLSGGVEVGETIHFTYTVRNSGPDPSASASCQIYTNLHPGYFAAPPTPSASGGAGPPTTCPKVFTAGPPVAVASPEDVLVVAGNQTICRSLFVSPASQAGGQVGDEACVPVVNKPYFKVYGGDLSAGSGLGDVSGSCVNNANAAIVGWNKGASGAYAGAGVQFAAFALSQIYEAATTVGNGAGSAAAPSGLAFAEDTASGSVYGGTFGSLPCLRNYYAGLPAGPQPFTNFASVTSSGAYQWTGAGTLDLSGQLPAGKRVTLFVTKDVLITGNVTYPISWSSADPPLFELIVSGGNIFVDRGVSQLDGVFIAQPDRGTGGTIYTCATGASPLTLDGSLHSTCNRKLTINGAFVANQVRFLRTSGTKQAATPNESAGSGNIAEVFNFSPALWMAQPVGISAQTTQYDSITSLPPVL